jgi:hypothetical protein
MVRAVSPLVVYGWCSWRPRDRGETPTRFADTYLQTLCVERRLKDERAAP